MAKLSLKANPTFPAKVAIPVAGAAAVLVELTFRHRTKTELGEFVASRESATDVDSFMAMVTGWELEAEFNRENADELLQNYIGAGVCTYAAYLQELTKSKSGN